MKLYLGSPRPSHPGHCPSCPPPIAFGYNNMAKCTWLQIMNFHWTSKISLGINIYLYRLVHNENPALSILSIRPDHWVSVLYLLNIDLILFLLVKMQKLPGFVSMYMYVMHYALYVTENEILQWQLSSKPMCSTNWLPTYMYMCI